MNGSSDQSTSTCSTRGWCKTPHFLIIVIILLLCYQHGYKYCNVKVQGMEGNNTQQSRGYGIC